MENNHTNPAAPTQAAAVLTAQVPYPQAPPAKRPPYAFTAADIFAGIFFLAMGFLFWEWNLFFYPASSLGTFLFVLLSVSGCLIYLAAKGIRQNPRSLTALGVVLLAALPFLLYDCSSFAPEYAPLSYKALTLFLFAACLLWLMYTGQRQIAEKLSGFLTGDMVNQTFVVPFYNFAAIFSSWKWGVANRRGGKAFFAVLIGTIAFVPILAIILNLLISSDTGFENMILALAELLDMETILRYLGNLLLGIPVACYVFGAVYGNAHGRGTHLITKQGTDRCLEKCHGIPRPALYSPLILLVVVYVTFFVAMGSYLFSAFSGDLPAAYTYAEYARKGFFELCGVALINLILVTAVWLFGKRSRLSYPRPLRLLTALLSSLTCLLIVTAISKLLLYIHTYGLSRLRVYSLWFLILLFVVFLLLLAWHIRPFNAGRPIIAACVLLILALFLANPDGLIVKHNLKAYETGRLNNLEMDMYRDMSDAVVAPVANYLKTHGAQMDDEEKAAAEQVLWEHKQRHENSLGFATWNIESARAEKYLKAAKYPTATKSVTTPDYGPSRENARPD